MKRNIKNYADKVYIMENLNTLIICESVHHGSTLKAARIMAAELNGDVKKPAEVTDDVIGRYDLTGFGSGIYNQKHHPALFELIETLPLQNNRKAFIFSTASICYKKMHEPLRIALTRKGFEIIDEFICRGFMDYSFTKYFFGGINKGRPDNRDLKKAADFALKLKAGLQL